jgi:uncharacterized protein (DUF1501 family)
MKTSRRIFLKGGALSLVSVGLVPGLGPSFLTDTVFADEPQRRRSGTGGRKILICIFQRGAVDGLSMVVPHGDPNYYRHRVLGGNGIALPRMGEGSILDLDGKFGLHPGLAPLLPIYKAGHMAPIQAVGSPAATRSHFEAQDYMEGGVPGRMMADGWLSRTILNCPQDAAREAEIFRGVALTGQVPRSLRGEADAIAIPDLKKFGVGSVAAVPTGGGARRRMAADAANATNNANQAAAAGFEAVYDQAVGDVLGGTGRESFEAIKMVQSLTAAPYVPTRGANYPRSAFGESLQQIAQLVKADVGVEVAFAESNGWDTHVGQGSTQGNLARRLTELGAGLAALYTDLGDRMADVVILTMSEFGRTVRQNGTGGTDHGHATCFLALGGNVNGGKVLGDWPGLAVEQLYEQRDLAVTTDFRDVFGEVAKRHMRVDALESVFPGRPEAQMKFRNLMRA